MSHPGLAQLGSAQGSTASQDKNRLELSRAVRRVVAGYLARQAHDGSYAAYSSLRDIKRDLDTPPERPTQEVIRLVNELLEGHQGLVQEVLATQKRIPGSVSHVRGVLDSLRVHTKPASMIDITLDEFKTLVPSFKHQITDLLDSPPFRPFSEDDARAIAMARWFKDTFMRWVDPVKCPVCGGATKFSGMVQPTEDEARDASRVEMHKCEDNQCGGTRRFARYIRDGKLVQTREGRCGEWAQLFYAFLRLAGLTARYVWADTDHVWTEYWSPALEHWVHADSCEAAVNKNLLYDKGWGKTMNFVIAVGTDGAEDVTRVYVSDWDACLARRYATGWSHRALRTAIAELTIDCRLNTYVPKDSDEAYWTRLTSLDRLQASWMNDTKRREAEAEWQELGGRTSGPAEWRARRAELGKVAKPTYEIGSEISGEQRLLGDAVAMDTGTCLTSGPGQTSAVFNSTPVSEDQSFRCILQFRIDAPPGSGAADGMAVVFSPEIKLGLSGYGLGYSGLGGQGDFAVEIDTYRTRDHADDPPTPHISVHSPPDAHHRHAIGCMDSLPNLSDGKVHTLELLYDGSTRTLRGYLKIHGEEEVGLWEVQIPKAEGERREWYVGVTGSCGGLWQRQDALSLQLHNISFK